MRMKFTLLRAIENRQSCKCRQINTIHLDKITGTDIFIVSLLRFIEDQYQVQVFKKKQM